MSIVIISLQFLRASSEGTIASISDLTPNDIVGHWEALMQKEGICGPNVYQMLFSSPKEAMLVEAHPGSNAKHVQFIGRLLSGEFANGRVKLVFDAIQSDQHFDYVSVEIEGRAYGATDAWMIDGTISKRQEDGTIIKTPLFFRNSLWTRSIAEASVTAEKAIKNAHGKK